MATWIVNLFEKKSATEKDTYLIPYSILLKFIYRRVQQEFLHVVPSDIGLDEPFKVEGNVLYIPPHTHVRKHLQFHAAYSGFDNDDVFFYCVVGRRRTAALGHPRFPANTRQRRRRGAF